MAKNNNLTDFLTDIANTIRAKKGTTLAINPQNFSSEIESIETGVDNPLIANSDAEMNTYLNDTKYLNMYVKFTGQSETYVTNEVYQITADVDKDPTQYMPRSECKNKLKELIDGKSDCVYLFYNFSGTSVNNIISYNDTENAKSMKLMFASCENLTTIPLLNTSNVTDMNTMFSSCKNLTTIPLLDTSKVTNMGNMFSWCYSLTTIPLLDTSNVTHINSMFNSCSVLTTIPLLNTNNATNMSYMFASCENLTTIPLLNTSNVTDMNTMFSSCKNLTTIPLLDTSKVTNMGNMFSWCYSLTTIPLLDTSNVTHINSMFNSCSVLTTIPLLNTNNATNMSYMFASCYKLTKIDISKLVNSSNDRFAYNCYSLKTLIIRTMDTIPSLQSSAFTNCYHFYGTVNATYNPDGLKDGRIYVPDDKVESLKTATNWSVFADIIVPLSTYVEEA